MIESPPKLAPKTMRDALSLSTSGELRDIVNQANEKYSYWSDLKYKRRPDGVSAETLWALVSFSRDMLVNYVWPMYQVRIPVTNYMQRLCHEFDMNFGGSWGSSSIIPSQDREKYLVSSIMEEAISSSQIEGASSTRKVAKDMLRRNIKPKTRSEQMIFNNYQAIRFLTEHKEDPLSEELLLRIHSLMTENTLDNPADVGRFRQSNDIVVANEITGELVHTPPPFEDIPGFVDSLCRFANEDLSNGAFIHPIIKAIAIHFMLAYVHPFVDGNGRTARSLFYWYMLKSGYWLTEYLSISRVIYRSKASYEKAYLYAENDRNDMGYFLTYHLRALEIAFEDLKSYIERKIAQKQRAVDFFRLGDINERQAAILSMVRDDPGIVITVSELCGIFQVTQPTIKSDLDKLVGRGLLSWIRVNGRRHDYVKGPEFDSVISRIGKA